MQLIYIHIPKTAGTFFKRILTLNYSKDRMLFVGGDDPRGTVRNTPPAISSVADVVTGHFTFDCVRHLFGVYKLFTVLRNPVDIVKSEYNFAMTNREAPQHLRMQEQAPTFEDWLQNREPFSMNVQCLYLSDWGFVGPRPSDDEIFGSAMRNLEKMDYVGVSDLMGLSLYHLEQVYGWKVENVPINVTTNKIVDDLDSQTQAWISACTWADQALYSAAIIKLIRSVGAVAK